MKTLHYAAHTLKGGSSNIGTTTFVELCRQIEESASQGSFEGFEQAQSDCQIECQKVLEALTILHDNCASTAKNL